MVIEVQEHPVFKRHGNDIVVDADLSLTKAVLGGEIEVPTLFGHVKMKIPAGTQSNKIFRLKEKGMPDVHHGEQGDELVRVSVYIPANLNSEQRKAMEEFAKASGEEVNKQSFGEKIRRTFK